MRPTKDDLALLERLRKSRAQHPSFGVGTDPNETGELADALSRLLEAGLVTRQEMGEDLIWWQARCAGYGLPDQSDESMDGESMDGDHASALESVYGPND